MEKWNLIQNQHYFATFYKTIYYFSQKRKIMVKNMLFGAKILKVNLRRPKLSMRVISCGFILRKWP